MEMKQTQRGTGLYSKHGPVSPLEKIQTGQPDEGSHVQTMDT